MNKNKNKINNIHNYSLYSQNKKIISVKLNPFISYKNEPKQNMNKHNRCLKPPNHKTKSIWNKTKIVTILERKEKLLKAYNNLTNITENKNGKSHNDILLNPSLNEKNKKNEKIIKSNNTIEIKDIYYNQMKGFHNNGSTCYLNSFLQILIHIPGLIKLLKDYKNEINENHLLYYLLNVADNPTINNLYYLKRKFNKLNSNCSYNGQDDSQEFGSEVLNILNNELFDLNEAKFIWNYKNDFNLNNNLKLESKYKTDKMKKLKDLLYEEESEFKFGTIISEIFYYYECSLVFNNNKLLMVDYLGEPDNKLSFYMKDGKSLINPDVKDMLKNKYLEGNNNKLVKLPKILMITLLRAVNNQPLIETSVKINEKIDLKEFIDTDFGKYNKPTEYTLYALNVCIGNSKGYGHYYAYILINKIWYKFDDSFVHSVNNYEIEKDLPFIYGIYYINNEYFNKL
jgi:ubiquitin C-terminal hydrolase